MIPRKEITILELNRLGKITGSSQKGEYYCKNHAWYIV